MSPPAENIRGHYLDSRKLDWDSDDDDSSLSVVRSLDGRIKISKLVNNKSMVLTSIFGMGALEILNSNDLWANVSSQVDNLKWGFCTDRAGVGIFKHLGPS